MGHEGTRMTGPRNRIQRIRLARTGTGNAPVAGPGRKGDVLVRAAYTMPWAYMASATLRKPATLAPTTRFPGAPHSSAAAEAAL